jgi:hypothetical protein
MVLATIASVIIAALIGIRPLSPLLFTATVFPFFYASLRRSDYHVATFLVIRWALALFVTLGIVGVFLPDRLGAALPLSESAVRTIERWITEPQSPPPADTGYILLGSLVFLAGSFLSGGLLGFIIAAVALGGAAYAALFVVRHGFNIFQVSLVALPVWQLSLFIAGALLLVPASVFVFERFLHVERRSEARARLKYNVVAAAGFFALSVLLRYAAADAWRSLVEKWTVL